MMFVFLDVGMVGMCESVLGSGSQSPVSPSPIPASKQHCYVRLLGLLRLCLFHLFYHQGFSC